MAGGFYEVDWSTLPVPEDDGATDHLSGRALPSLPLAATNGDAIDLAGLSGLTILYVYPKTGQPWTEMPDGWDLIPGARGCTPQSCAFRDHHSELLALGAKRVFGLSTQSTAYQREAKERMHLPFELLSDGSCAFADALSLPTFEAGGERLIKRLSLAIDAGRIVNVIYPVFPPDRNAALVLDWLAGRAR